MKWVEVLGRKFDWPEEDVAEVRSQIERFAEKVMPKTVLDAVKADPDDNRILECALAAGSDFIVSGDKDLLRLGTYDSYSLFDNRLHPEGVCFEAGITFLVSPDGQRNSRQFIDCRYRFSVLRHIDALDVGLAGVAGFDANVIGIFDQKDRKLFPVLFAAVGAFDPAKLPFGGAQRADEAALSAVPLPAQNGCHRLRAAEWTGAGGRQGVRGSPARQILGVGLHQSASEESSGFIECHTSPAILQNLDARLGFGKIFARVACQNLGTPFLH
jgi:hypothetical protein